MDEEKVTVDNSIDNNKGFSILELIVVIGILSILVVIAALQFIFYLEKANVSADIQLCDSIQEALQMASTDPSVVTNNDGSSDLVELLRGGTVVPLSGLDGDTLFNEVVRDITGFDAFDDGECLKFMSSRPARTSGVIYCQTQGGILYVWLNHSDAEGHQGDYTAADATELIPGQKTIFAY